MAINDVVEMVLTTTFFGNEFNNRFYYFLDDAGSTAQGLCEAWDAFNAADWASAIYDGATLTGLSARNIDDLSDVGSLVINHAGGRAGSVLSAFYGVALELGAASPLIAAGRKYISPISEVDVNGSTLEPAYQAVVDDVADDMLETIADLANNLYSPCMFSPANLTHAFDVASSLVESAYKRISTQNSRKGF